MGLIDKVKKMFGAGEVTLVYNGRPYRIEASKLKLDGSGTIYIHNKEGCQQSKITGNFSKIKMDQDNGRTYVNGVDIGRLVKDLEEK